MTMALVMNRKRLDTGYKIGLNYFGDNNHKILVMKPILGLFDKYTFLAQISILNSSNAISLRSLLVQWQALSCLGHNPTHHQTD